MEDSPQEPGIPESATSTAYASKTESLQRRVSGAAQALADKGIRPTVTRIRAALGGGSPNDLAPALKYWKDSVGPIMPLSHADSAALPRIPIQIADLAHEIWHRANVAATVELKGGPAARATAIRTEEVESLRSQVSGLRDQLQRESLAFGELRAQAARYEAMAHNALIRADEAEVRERKRLRDLGTARQRITELEVIVNLLREGPPAPKVPRRRASVTKVPRLSKPAGARKRKTARTARVPSTKSRLPRRRGTSRQRHLRRPSRE